MSYQALLLLFRGQLEEAKSLVAATNKEDGARREHSYHYSGLLLEGVLAAIQGDDATLYALIDLSGARYLDMDSITSNISSWVFDLWFLTLMYCCLEQDSRTKSILYDLLVKGLKMKSSTIQQLSLPIAAVLAAREGYPGRAVKLLSLAHTAPDGLIGWMAHWQLLNEIRADLESQLGLPAYTTAWEHGTQLDLEQAIADLLAEYASETQ